MISIIIPVLNEASTIELLLRHLDNNSTSGKIQEVIIVDGGSSDDTVQLANSYRNNGSVLPYHVIHSEKGRAKQMNLGARKAKGEVLYFLHADSLPPNGFDTSILEHVETGKKAGCFRMKFDSRHPVLVISQWFTRFNFRTCRGGDQSLYISREMFDVLEGFNEEFEVYEDCEFIGRIYDQYKFNVIRDYVITSARKYGKNGTWRLQYHFAIIHAKKWMGASPKDLSRYYHRHIRI